MIVKCQTDLICKFNVNGRCGKDKIELDIKGMCQSYIEKLN